MLTSTRLFHRFKSIAAYILVVGALVISAAAYQQSKAQAAKAAKAAEVTAILTICNAISGRAQYNRSHQNIVLDRLVKEIDALRLADVRPIGSFGHIQQFTFPNLHCNMILSKVK